MPSIASSTERALARLWRVAAIGLALALPVAGNAQNAELAAAVKRWHAAALSSYEYGYRKYCACHPDSPPETIVTVRDGKVVGVRHRPVGYNREVPAEAKNLQYYWTVDGLFALLDSAFGRHAEVRVQYDSTLGFPKSIYIDYDPEFIGDELDVRLTGITPLAR
jgi:hypothetical protein